jgi:UTP--glucose-1-phosphate uridylyltransferase
VCAADVPRDRTASYGIVTPGGVNGNRTEVLGLVEKPMPDQAPSTLGVIGRYILQPEVMRVLDAQETGAGGEIQLTDAMARLIGTQPFHAVTVDATRFDCGTKLGFVQANLALGLADPEIGDVLRNTLAGAK